MKFYPKQSVCPHCNTVYRYSDVKKIMWKKTGVCYHCGKSFNISRSGLWILALETAVICALLNIAAIGAIKGLSVIGLFCLNIIPAIAAVILVPFYISLTGEKTKKKKRKQK